MKIQSCRCRITKGIYNRQIILDHTDSTRAARCTLTPMPPWRDWSMPSSPKLILEVAQLGIDVWAAGGADNKKRTKGWSYCTGVGVILNQNIVEMSRYYEACVHIHMSAVLLHLQAGDGNRWIQILRNSTSKQKIRFGQKTTDCKKATRHNVILPILDNL